MPPPSLGPTMSNDAEGVLATFRATWQKTSVRDKPQMSQIVTLARGWVTHKINEGYG